MIIIDSLWLWWLWSFRLVYLVLVVAFFLGLEGDDKHVVAVVEKNILSFFLSNFTINLQIGWPNLSIGYKKCPITYICKLSGDGIGSAMWWRWW